MDSEKPAQDSLTVLLSNWAAGDQSAFEQLMPLVYDQMRLLARQLLLKERSGHTLSSTALVHEAYLKLIDQTRTSWSGRAHFFGAASTTMRRILVDHARSRNSLKRGEGRVADDIDRVTIAVDPKLDILELDRALNELAAFDPARAHIVELRYFGGLSIEETAAILDCSPATVKRDWTIARAWLYRQLTGEPLD